MVRRQAATNLAKFCKEMPAAIVVDEMIPFFQHLAQDDQDSVRLLTVEVLISIAEAVPKEQQSSHGVLLTSLRNLIEDKSWRVRYMIADRFEKVRRCHLPILSRTFVLTFVFVNRSPRPSTKKSFPEIWFLHSSNSSKTMKPKSEPLLPARFQASAPSLTEMCSSMTS